MTKCPYLGKNETHQKMTLKAFGERRNEPNSITVRMKMSRQRNLEIYPQEFDKHKGETH